MLEQFTEWVQCHCLTDIAAAVVPVEDHLAIHSRGQASEGRHPLVQLWRPTGGCHPCLLSSTVRPSYPLPSPKLILPLFSLHAGSSRCRHCSRPTGGSSSARAGLLEVRAARSLSPRVPAHGGRPGGHLTPSPGPGGTYSVPVRLQGGIHQAMVDSGCMQSIIHQNLV